MSRIAAAAVAACLVLGAASDACAQASNPAAADPWEPFNRFGFGVFMALDKVVVRPLALAYQQAVPRALRAGVHNALVNMGEPVVGMNDVLQGHFRQAGRTTVRFVTNSTLGIAGLFDMAASAGLPHHDNGFDLTLGRYHVVAGPYLFLPLVGPTTARDLFGSAVDGAMDPLHWVNYPHRPALSIAHSVVGGIDQRARNDAMFESLLSDATDPYATLRSVYLQNEQGQIDEGRPPSETPLPEFDDDKPAPPATSAPAAPQTQPPAAAPADAPTPPPPAADPSPAAPPAE